MMGTFADIYIYVFIHIHTAHMLLHTSCCNIAQTQDCPSDLNLFASLNLCQDCNGDEEGNEEEQEELPEFVVTSEDVDRKPSL